MLAELIMHVFGWTDAWYAHPGPPLYGSYYFAGQPGLLPGWGRSWRSLRSLSCSVRRDGRFHVGVWTGPQHDLICVRGCDTNEEAERWLSPGGVTITIAAIRAAVRRVRLDRRATRCST